METYKGKINEFVDWVSGVNELTGNRILGVSEDTPISGKSIRELIQGKLKTPFVTYEDTNAGLIRFFSSVEAKNAYLQYLDQGDEDSISKANDLIIYNMDMPAVYRITGLDSFVLPRYIIEGNSLSANAQLDITLGLEDALGSSDFDVMTVSYQIVDDTGNVRYSASDQLETGKQVVKNIYSYLKSGENKVTISVRANNHKATTTKMFSIFLVTFSISSNFSGYYNPVANGSPFSFDIFINRSITNLPVETTVYIDGTIASYNDTNHSNAVWRYSGHSANPTNNMQIYNRYESSTYEIRRKHTMEIRSRMQDAETGTDFSSNILVYEFEVAPSADDMTHMYINLAQSISNSAYTDTTYIDENGLSRTMPMIKATQYLPMTIDWGYNTDAFSVLQLVDVLWQIRTGVSGSYVYTPISNIRGIKSTKPEALTFIPSLSYSFERDHSYIVATIDNQGTLEEMAIYPLGVEESSMTVSEYGNYTLKLSAYGKTNTSDSRAQWIDEYNQVYTTFSSGVTFDSSNGWSDNSLVLKGSDSYAIIDYCPFPSMYNGIQYRVLESGATFEIDFKPEYISNEDDILITIGDPTAQHIRIMTNTAGYYTGNIPVVKTNYKSGERIKLAFIFNRSEKLNESDLVYIVNNGILERAAARGTAPLTNDAARIKIGGTESSVRVYMIRAYRQDLTPKQALDNYMFDNASDIALLSRNDIYGASSTVTYSGVSGKLDIIVIEGDLTNILSNKDAKENATVNIRRESNVDSSRNFTIENCRIRNHGLSTLSYPITSMKVWFNKSNKFDEQTGTIELAPTFNCQQQAYLGLNKNRYVMKLGAIPSNKFVLQANYADSSGTHNGSLLRLMLDTWYNASINGEFKLRTSPQLFASGASITHENAQLNEDGSWVEGVYNIDPESANYMPYYAGKTWPQITGKTFPYQIRMAADSFPCIVFYRDLSSSGNDQLTLLGQYVFMDDKKSDFVYGERSIYNTDDLTDPFCLKIDNSKKDTNANKVWDNDKVLQIEVVYPNSPLTSYYSKTVASSYTLDENDNLVEDENATIMRFDDVTKRDSNNKPTEYLWEQHFELIYPDKEDITDKNDNFDPDKFATTVQPFEDFLEWITDVAALKNTGAKLGDSGAQAHVTSAELNKFIEEAHDHLDLYKLAAYYVFFLRFGLVDSVERNAQLKTYDGQHWHYEPWDMDIALGCANNGVIAYDPPITRDTRTGGSGYVFSGRTANQSNVLWDCLECWEYWSKTIVHDVAQALYDAGLTYENCIKMFDEQYVEKWSETLYNESGQYKYIQATDDPRYRLYLNGARTSHRHWWLSKSMNYYDAKWECGDFTKNTIVFRIGKPADVSNKNLIKIYPTQNTFFEAVYGAEGNRNPIGAGLTEAGVGVGQEATIDAQLQLEDKQPCLIYGATSIKKLDLSRLLDSTSGVLGNGYTDIKFGGAYDAVLGAQIKELVLGAPCTPDIYTNPNSTSYTSNMTVGQNDISGVSDEGFDALENLEHLNVIGWNTKRNQQAGGWLSNLMSENGHDRKNIDTLYAMGCDMATEFATATTGNNFTDIRLPDTITDLTFTNSSWENLSFWHTTETGLTSARYDKVSGIPATIRSVNFAGSTGKNQCSLDFVLAWIDAIEDTLPVSHTEQDLYDELATRTLLVDQADWGRGTTQLTYRDILRLANFGKGGYLYPIKGYVLIQDDGEGLNAAKLTLLQSLFGSNVFNIGTTNSNLVVDYQNNQIIISISGIEEALTLDGDDIWIKEPNGAKLNANHFTLTTGQNDNHIVDNESNDPTITSNLTNGKYIWGFVASQDSDNSTMVASLSYARLEVGNDGIVRLRTSEGDGNNYTMYIRVVYGTIQNSSVIVSQDTIVIKVEGVTYPSGYSWLLTGTGEIQEFKYSESVARALFGNTIATTLCPVAGTPATIYVLRASGLTIEFALKPNEPKYYYDGGGVLHQNWTANPNTERIEYYVKEHGTASVPSNNQFSAYMDRSVFLANEGNTIDIGVSTYAFARDNATNGGVPIKASLTLSTDPVLFQINGRVNIGGKDLITSTVYFMVIDDPTPVIVGNSSSALSRVMWGKYADAYNISNAGQPLDLYKSHLLGLTGAVDFSSETGITSLITTNNDTILKYIPFVTLLNFEGCSALTKTDAGSLLNNLDFSNNAALESLSLNGCTALNTETIDLTPCTSLDSLDTRGSRVGVILANNTIVTELLLGSPAKLVINGAATLGESGTIYSVQGDDYLDDLQLININLQNVRGFTIFDNIYGGD